MLKEPLRIFSVSQNWWRNTEITFDSSVENAFLIHQPDKIVKFEHTPEGLYMYRVDKDYKTSLKEKRSINLVTTLSENPRGYTD